jgi:hypothetical protein
MYEGTLLGSLWNLNRNELIRRLAVGQLAGWDVRREGT